MSEAPLTKQDLEQAMTALTQDLRSFVDARIERSQEELLGAIRASETRLVAEIITQAERVETKLLTEFHKYARRSEIMRRSTDHNLQALAERVQLLESRLDENDEKRNLGYNLS